MDSDATQSSSLGETIRFEKAEERFWNKPLVHFRGRATTAELAILALEKKPGEGGAWLNSGIAAGAEDLVRGPAGKLGTVRGFLPDFVRDALAATYAAAGITRGASDLALWNERTRAVRFVEVKWRGHDSIKVEQLRFLDAAASAGHSTAVREWEFS